MAFIPLALAIFQFIFRLWDAINENDEVVKAKKVEILKDAAESIAKQDKAGITISFDRINRL